MSLRPCADGCTTCCGTPNEPHEQRKEEAEATGVWPNTYKVEDCVDCPFFQMVRGDRPGGCAVNKTTWRPFTMAEDRVDEPPEWCPLRSGDIRVGFVGVRDG